MNKRIIEALEYSLQAIEDGASVESVLARFPDLARELGPILRTAQQARARGIPEPSAQAIRREKQKLLQRAAQMRAPKRGWFVVHAQRLAFSLALASIFLLSGTGLVRASSSTLPGDELYPVKRSWEDVRLLFVTTPQHREALESEYEQERLDEVAELLVEKRQVAIAFRGLVTLQQDGELLVSGVPVLVSADTIFAGAPPKVGDSILVSGVTDMNGHVLAQGVQILPAGSLVPVGEDDHQSESQGEDSGAIATPSSSEGETDHGSGKVEGASSGFHLEGNVQSIQGNVMVVDGRTVYLDQVGLQGTISAGSRVEVNGYFTPDGRFIATSLEIKQGETEGENKQNEDNHQQEQEDHQNGDQHEDGADS